MPNTDNPHGFVYERNLDGGSAPTLKVLLKSNVSVTKGDEISLETTGLADLATAAQSPVAGIAAESIVGAATARANLLVYDPAPNVVFSCQADSGTSQTMFGKSLDVVASTGAFELDSSSSGGKWRVVGLREAANNAWGSHADLLVICEESAWLGTA